jgi:hypothetical protein
MIEFRSKGRGMNPAAVPARGKLQLELDACQVGTRTAADAAAWQARQEKVGPLKPANPEPPAAYETPAANPTVDYQLPEEVNRIK